MAARGTGWDVSDRVTGTRRGNEKSAALSGGTYIKGLALAYSNPGGVCAVAALSLSGFQAPAAQ